MVSSHFVRSGITPHKLQRQLYMVACRLSNTRREFGEREFRESKVKKRQFLEREFGEREFKERVETSMTE